MADATARTEQATPKRRETARRHGHVVMSPEIAPVAVLLVVLALATVGAPVLVRQTGAVMREWLAAVGPIAAHEHAVSPLAWRSAWALAGALGPFFVVVAVVGIGAVVAQVGWHPSPELVRPDARRIALATGWERLVSRQGVASLVRAVVKIVLVVGVGWRVLLHVGGAALGASDLSIEGVLALVGGGLRELGLGMAAAFVVVGAGDYAWARWWHEQRLKMSRHELREELRQSDGDPRIRMRFRRAHRELAKRRLLGEVARTDVVLADPGQVAVALRYRADESEAPRVLAKGASALARKIEDTARGAGIPIVERRALARALFRTVAVGGELPPALCPAVAEVPAYVDSLRTGSRGDVG